MKAMILAAGLGARLRPITDACPKALVEIGGRTFLEITLARLRSFGICEVIINVHHFADMVIDYLKENANFGMRIELSREDVLLDTGGGLKKAAWFFADDSKQIGGPFILHNVDVVSTIDFARMLELHSENRALATLAVQKRETNRYLLFDEQLQLCGRHSASDQHELAPAVRGEALAFSGIHVISPRIFNLMKEEGIFSIISTYLRLATAGEKIMAFRADKYYWRDLGRPSDLKQAERDLEQKALLP